MLSRLLLTTSLILLHPLFAETKSCFSFFPGSYIMIDGHPAFAVKKDTFLSLKCPSGKKIVAQDPFRGLCLFEQKVSKPLPLSDAKPPLYICPDKRELDRPIRSFPVSIFAGELTVRPGHEGALFAGCCRLAGIFDAEGGWFDAASIRRLVKGETYHGDIGVRFATIEGKVAAESVDPFASSGFRPGDVVLGIGDGSRPDLRDVRDRIDRCAEGEKVPFTVKRGEKRLKIEAQCFERTGGGAISDTFLERFGTYFSKSLRIEKIDPSSMAYKRGLRVGDRLLMIDGKSVEKEEDVRALLSGYGVQKSTPENMLWEREGFQFFLLPASL